MTKQAEGRGLVTNEEVLCKIFDNMWVYSPLGGISISDMLDHFDDVYRSHGVDHFLIDSFVKCGFADDDYTGQKGFVDQLRDFARTNNVQVHLVCHARKKTTEYEEPDEFDIKGTPALRDVADNVFIVWRKKKEEILRLQNLNNATDILEPSDEGNSEYDLNAPDCKIICAKQRNGHWEGKIGLFFDTDSCQYLSHSNDRPINYCDLFSQKMAAPEGSDESSAMSS